MERQYKITEDQVQLLEHYKRMFEYNADEIRNLCKEEMDDISLGFELGQLHSHLRTCFLEMMALAGEIRNQEIITEEDKYMVSNSPSVPYLQGKYESSVQKKD